MALNLAYGPDTDPGLDTDTEDGYEIDLDTVIFAFLNLFESPTDQQLHAFAGLLGMDYRDLETRVFELFKQEVDDAADDGTLEELDEDDDLDGVDVFLISYFLAYSSPSEEQFHALADMMGVSAPDLEAYVYRLLSQLSGEQPDLDAIQRLDSVDPDDGAALDAAQDEFDGLETD